MPETRVRSALLALTLVVALVLGGCAGDERRPSFEASPEITTVATAGSDVAHPTVAVDRSGRRVYVAWTEYPSDSEALTYLAASEDGGTTFGTPRRLGAKTEDHPVLEVADDGTLFAAWTHWDLKLLINPKDEYSNAAWQLLARSSNGGRTFTEPVQVPSGRSAEAGYFLALAVAPGGKTVSLGWLDYTPLNRGEALPAGLHEGAPFVAATSTDGGATFGKPARLTALSCVCCMPAGFVLDGRPGFALRGLDSGDVRNPQAVVANDPAGPWNPSVTIYDDGFRLNVCPHVGLGADVGRDDTARVAWWTGAEGRRAVWYSTSKDGEMWAEPLKVADLRTPPHDHDVSLAVDGRGTSWITTVDVAGKDPAVQAWAVPDEGTPAEVEGAQVSGGLPDVAAFDRGAVIVWAEGKAVKVRRLGDAPK